MVKSSFREAKAWWVYENGMSTIHETRCFTFPCPQNEGSSSPFQSRSQSKGLESPEVSAERCPQPQKEDLHITHLPVAQDSAALEAAQIPWKEQPGGASLTATPSSNSPNHWVNLEEDRRRQHTAHCGCQGQQGPDQMDCEEALWPWYGPKSTPSYCLTERRRVFSSVLIMTPWMLLTKLGSSKLSPSG